MEVTWGESSGKWTKEMETVIKWSVFLMTWTRATEDDAPVGRRRRVRVAFLLLFCAEKIWKALHHQGWSRLVSAELLPVLRQVEGWRKCI